MRYIDHPPTTEDVRIAHETGEDCIATFEALDHDQVVISSVQFGPGVSARTSGGHEGAVEKQS